MNGLFGWTRDGASARSSRRGRAIGLSIGLLYLLPNFVQSFGFPAHRAVLALLGLAAFVAAYLGLGLIRNNFTDPLPIWAWPLLVVFVLLTAGLPFAFHDWIGLPIYLSVICAVVLPTRAAVWSPFAAAALAYGQMVLLDAPTGAVMTVTVTALSIGLMMLGFRRSRSLVLELQEARGEVARLAATEERLRIARDLHDLLGHSLSLIVLKSELARRIAERDPAKTVGEINDIESVARQALADVREAVSGYRQRSLAEELDSARAVLSAAGIEPVVRTSGTPLPDLVDGLFGWALREGVTNVVRHARASRCTITIARDGGDATLELCDDGLGDGSHVPGNGLTGLTERIAAAGGTVESGPRPAGGFRLAVRAPLRPAAVAEPERSVESRA